MSGAWALLRNEDAAALARVAASLGRLVPADVQQRRLRGDWHLLWVGKRAIADPVLAELGDALCAVAGTLLYRGLGPLSSARHLLDDWKGGTVRWNELHGTFAALIDDGQRRALIRDREGLADVFVVHQTGALSTSFLAALAASPMPHRLDREAALEILVTGTLIGPRTLIAGVERLDSGHQALRDICLLAPPAKPSERPFRSREEALEGCLASLKECAARLRPLADHGAGLGLTGGHDSRLLLLLLLGAGLEPVCHTHWKPAGSQEAVTARALCALYGLELTELPTPTPSSLDEPGLAAAFENGLLGCDGQVRLDSPWCEAQVSGEYRRAVLGSARLALSGIGGEQYRNEERLLGPMVDLRSWVRWEVIRARAGPWFRHTGAEKALVDRIVNGIRERLGLGSQRRVPRLAVKRYLNEVFLPAGRGARVNHDGRIAHALLPFADWRVAETAYRAVPHLGPAYGFQQAMIRRLDPMAAQVPLDSGLAFARREPLANRARTWVKAVVPAPVLTWRRERLVATASRNRGSRALINSSEFLGGLVEAVRALDLPIRLDSLLARQDTAHVTLDLGYFLQYLARGERQ